MSLYNVDRRGGREAVIIILFLFFCLQLYSPTKDDYNRLLTKYAEAENTIDRLRLEAKVWYVLLWTHFHTYMPLFANTCM